MRKRLATITAALALSLTLWVAAALGQPGDLDTSFSGDGKLTTSFTGSADGANAVAIQADGKIVVVGSMDTGFAIARYNPNGTLDTAGFGGGDGKVTIEAVADGNFAEALAVAVQPDQKIVVAGFAYSTTDLGSEDFAIARLNTDGSLDTAGFGGGDGTVVTPFLPPDFDEYNQDRVEAVGVQVGDGDIVAAGTADTLDGGGERDFGVARYDSNGILDSGFGGDGLVSKNLLGVDFGHDLALVPPDKVLVVGSTQQSGSTAGFALAQFEPDGDPDLTFDSDGVRVRDFSGSTDSLEGVMRQADGKILAAGRIGGDSSVARFNANGSNDNSFDDNGYSNQTFTNTSTDQWNDVAIEGSGKILVAGLTYEGGADFAVGRFLANGAVDRTFGAHCSGARKTDFAGPDSDGAESLALDGSGRMVTAGYADSDFGLARYLAGPGAVADCVAPNTTIKGPRKTTRRRPTYRLISSEAGSKFRCRINGRGTGKPFNPCTSPFKMPRLRLGATRFEVKAIDKAGNADPTPAFLKIKRIRRG
jgi:uncharacterized delta-60 repeat protein